MSQNKQLEADFFNLHATEQDYNVFTDEANAKIVSIVEALLQPTKESKIADFGCGSGIFTQLLQQKGYLCLGLDLSDRLLKIAKTQAHSIDFVQGDVEALPFNDNSLDYIMLSCLVHHLPDPLLCAKEIFRVLKPEGKFIAFDPNRLNPFMYLYRDKSSPFYSAKGVTPNERPVLPHQVRDTFSKAGFKVASHYVNGLSYRYVASKSARAILPLYNFIDRIFFQPSLMRPFRAFVFTYGIKSA